MLLNVNFVYEAKVKHKRKVNAVDAHYLATIPVEIREPDGAQAPVAMRLRTHSTYDRAPGVELELRLFDGVLYAPLYEVAAGRGDRAAPTKRGADWIRTVAAQGYTRRSAHEPSLPLAVGASHERNGPPVRPNDDPLLREIVESKEAAMAARLAEQARDLILVDGVLHARSPEPVYRVCWMDGPRSDPYAGYEYLLAEIVHDGKRRELVREYRADELDHLRERRPELRVDAGEVIEVLVPEAVRADVPHRLFLQRAGELREWMKGQIATRDVPYFMAYHDLRECLARDGGPIARGDVAAGGEAAREAEAALGRISDAVEAVLAAIPDEREEDRLHFEALRARLAGIGAWRDFDAASIPAF